MDCSSVRSRFFPLRLAGGYFVESASREQVFAFIEKHFEDVFPGGRDERYFRMDARDRERLKPMYDSYQKIHHEFFLFKNDHGETVGWSMGETEDAITFYLSNTGILPTHQGRSLYTQFCKTHEAYLFELGYQRLSSHHMVTNRPGADGCCL